MVTVVGTHRRGAPLNFQRARLGDPRLLRFATQNYTFLQLLLHILTRYFAIFSTECGVARNFSRLERAAIKTLCANGLDVSKAQMCNVWTARTHYFEGKSVLFSSQTRCFHVERSVFSTPNKYLSHPKQVSFAPQTRLVCISKETCLGCEPIFGVFQNPRMRVQAELF